MQIGNVVTYVDEVSVPHKALITAVHGPQCINLIYIAKDEKKRDPYGQQVERASSVQKKAEWTAHGRYFIEE